MPSYEKHSNGKWSVRFREIENFETKNKRLSGFKTKKDAELAYLEYKSQTDEERFNKFSKSATKLMFLDLYNEYCELQKTRIKESSYIDLLSKCNLHLVPYFKKYKVVLISPKVILKWQNSLSKYSYEYKCNLRAYLHAILKYAEQYYRIPNQIKFVDSFKNLEQKKEMQIWEEDEFLQFINCVDEIEIKAFFSALYLTGARKGELIATTWNDWDLKNKKLTINKNVTRKTADKTKRYEITTTKNRENRTISIPDNLLKIMLEYKKSLSKINESDFTFGGKEPIASSTIDNRFKAKCKLSGVKKIRIHDFRHSHASYLISHGVSIVAVAKRLGHTNIEQTLNTYSHLMKNDDSDLIDKINQIII